MTDQLAIPVPATGPARPVVIPPGAPRCWILDRPEADDDYPNENHYPDRATFLAAYAGFDSDAKPKRLSYACAIAACMTCGVRVAGEYDGQHFPSWDEAERVARIEGWAIGDRGEFTCPECRPEEIR
jgi:hypothetical protein